MNKKFFFIFMVIPLVTCRFLFMVPLSVIAWTPAEEVVSDLEQAIIAVTFSQAVDSEIAERAFSFRVDNEIQEGTISWDGNRTLTFTPFQPLGQGNVHEIRVESSCEDIYGNSLDTSFSFLFFASSDRARPGVAGTDPLDNSIVDDPYYPLVIRFSEPMDGDSVLAALQVTPGITASYHWSGAGDELTILPYQSYTWQEEYWVTLDAAARDKAGNELAQEYIFHFAVGSDNTAPAIQRVAGESGLVLPPSPPGSYVETPGWEATWLLSIDFSEDVSTDDLAGRIHFEPTLTFDFSDPGSPFLSTVDLVMDQRFIYDTVYQLIISDGFEDRQGNPGEGATYYFRVDGPLTAPPEVVRITFLQDPSNGASIVDLYRPDAGGYWTADSIDFTNYDTPIPYELGFFDIYLRLADLANQDLDLLRWSFIDSFDITAGNACAEIIPLAVEISPADPIPIPGADEIVLRCHCEMYNNISIGIVEFSLEEQLSDGLDNPLDAPFVVRINK